MSFIYLVTEYIYNTEGHVLGSEPVAAFDTLDAALSFLDAHYLGDDVVEVSLNETDPVFPQVVYSGNADAAEDTLTEFFKGKRGKKR